MCLILLAYKVHPNYPLIIAANRDEQYNRPTASAQFWADYPNLLAGRDLEAMGTWFGVTKEGRFAAITNYRAPSLVVDNARSRGELVTNYLIGNASTREYLINLQETRDNYNGYNLILGDINCCWYYSNISNQVEEVKPGIHGLSNHFLDTPWTKVNKGKENLARCIQDPNFIEKEKLFTLLYDDERANVEELPDTGVGLEWETILSSIFVKSPNYGTRASTVMLIDRQKHILFSECSFIPDEPQWEEVNYEFNFSS